MKKKLISDKVVHRITCNGMEIHEVETFEEAETYIQFLVDDNKHSSGISANYGIVRVHRTIWEILC